MSNVISLGLPRRQSFRDRLSAIVDTFAHHRRTTNDVYWLKENAELLNILEVTRPDMADDALAPYAAIYAGLGERLAFFPQYYRFLLALALDLEDLGLPGDEAERYCAQVMRAGLEKAELSDLQRAEAWRLLSRRLDVPRDASLEERLRLFAGRSSTFALPNKKAAYELTHIVFYLSEYGRRDPELDAAILVSLEYAGLLAFLDQDADLLSEVCIALRYAARTPSQIWEDWLHHGVGTFSLQPSDTAPLADHYHDYFVTSQWASLAGYDPFPGQVPGGRMMIYRQFPNAGPLRTLSEYMFGLGTARSADWHGMRPMIADLLAQDQYDVLAEAEQSSPHFESFFERFARAGGQ